MSRITRDGLGLLLAGSWAKRGTCCRRKVGCVLVDVDGHELSTGYNGPPSGEPHCTEAPCPGAGMASGTGLSTCEAIHAEANALLRCKDVDKIHTAYVTASPCIDCVKLLMNTSCVRIVFSEPYAHDAAAKERWTRTPIGVRYALHHSAKDEPVYRTWEQGVREDIEALFADIAHGDDTHRDWLLKALCDHFAGRPVKRLP